MLRPVQNLHGGLDPRFLEHVPRPNNTVADDLHDQRLVGKLHGEQRRLFFEFAVGVGEV